MTDDELEALRRRAERTFGGKPMEEAITPVRAIVGPKMPRGQELAEAARRKLKDRQTPSPTELAALEVMIRVLRPAVMVRHGAFDSLPGTSAFAVDLAALWQTFGQRAAPLAFSVGRIDTIGGEHLGTGFLVAPDRIVTNHHVLEALSYGTFELEPGMGEIRFQQQYEPADSEDPVAITRVVADEAYLDIALLEIAPIPGPPRPVLTFAAQDPNEGDMVAVLGYPMRDVERRNPRFTEAIFADKYDIKRASPGEIVRRAAPITFHDCSTLGGNSGSPVLSLTSAEVVGLHRSGAFMYRNEAVGVEAVRDFVGRN
jgi:S1-C subfamily serine protease